MIGHEGVLRAVFRLLVDYGAQAARLVEEQSDLPAGTITTPAAHNTHNAWVNVAKGEFPTWMVLPTDTPARRTASYAEDTGVEDITEWQYPVMIAHHVAGKDPYECQLHRARLLLVVRTLLIQGKKIYSNSDGERLVVYLDEMQELTGGQSQNQTTQQHLMEAFTLFHVSSVEKTPAPQGRIGYVEDISSDSRVDLMGQ